MLFRYRNYLPHLEIQTGTYFVTFRLADSVPRHVTENWKLEIKEIQLNADRQNRELTQHEKHHLKYLLSGKIQKYMDQGWVSVG